MSDCKHKWVGSAFDPIQCACCGMMLTAWQARRIRELEQRLAAMEANMPKSAIDLERENFALRERLAAVEGLPRFHIETTYPMMDKGPSIKWVATKRGEWVRADDLLAALRPQQQNAEDCAE